MNYCKIKKIFIQFNEFKLKLFHNAGCVFIGLDVVKIINIEHEMIYCIRQWNNDFYTELK